MNNDYLNYALSSLPFLPYSKAAAKFVLSHSASLSLGLVAFLTSKTLKGDAAMKTPEWFDYVFAHPFALPFWILAIPYMFMTLSPLDLVEVVFLALYFLFWLRLYLQSLTTILEADSVKTCAEEERTELVPCIRVAKQHAVIPN